MSHRGSLLCLPDAIWAWDIAAPAKIDRYSLDRVFKSANSIDTLLIGTGTGVRLPPPELRQARTAARRGRADRRTVSGSAPAPESAAFCADLVRSHDFPRYAATLFAPAAER